MEGVSIEKSIARLTILEEDPSFETGAMYLWIRRISTFTFSKQFASLPANDLEMQFFNQV